MIVVIFCLCKERTVKLRVSQSAPWWNSSPIPKTQPCPQSLSPAPAHLSQAVFPPDLPFFTPVLIRPSVTFIFSHSPHIQSVLSFIRLFFYVAVCIASWCSSTHTCFLFLSDFPQTCCPLVINLAVCVWCLDYLPALLDLFISVTLPFDFWPPTIFQAYCTSIFFAIEWLIYTDSASKSCISVLFSCVPVSLPASAVTERY